MDLFKCFKKTQDAKPGKIEQFMIDPGIVYANTVHLINYLQTDLLKQYEALIHSGKSLNLEQYNVLIGGFKKLAHSFEAIFAVMSFDMEKLVEINKYQTETSITRQDLVKFINAPDIEPPKQGMPPAAFDTPGQAPQQKKVM